MGKRQKYLDWIREQFGSIEEYIKMHYGKEAPYNIVGNFCLVHLDDPDEETIRKRVQEFLLDDGLDDDCPLCQMEREEGSFVVYDGCDGWCPDCKQRDTCENYDPELWEESDSGEVDLTELDHDAGEKRLWKRSLLNMEAVEEEEPSIAIQILLTGIWGHLLELKMDLEQKGYGQEIIASFYEPYHAASESLKSFLKGETSAFVPTEFSVNVQATVAGLSQLEDKEFREKVADLKIKLEKLLDLVDEIGM